jgi:5-methylcytosine-specific restriction endonuclease McrA
MKTCKKCLLPFDLSHFSERPSNEDGYYSFCKDCEEIVKEARKKYYKEWCQRNRSQLNEYSLQRYYKNHEANKERARLRARTDYAKRREILVHRAAIWRRTRLTKEQKRLQDQRYRTKHYEQSLKRARDYHAQHRDHCNARSRAYRKTHLMELRPGHADNQNKRRARMNAAAIIEKVDRNAVYERDNGICHICHRKVSEKTFTLDHLIPIAHHGDHTAINLAVAHRRCNSRRGPGRLPAQLRLIG